MALARGTGGKKPPASADCIGAVPSVLMEKHFPVHNKNVFFLYAAGKYCKRRGNMVC